MALHDWTVADLESCDRRIRDVADSFGLAP